jgi:hypothetical protein
MGGDAGWKLHEKFGFAGAARLILEMAHPDWHVRILDQTPMLGHSPISRKWPHAKPRKLRIMAVGENRISVPYCFATIFRRELLPKTADISVPSDCELLTGNMFTA